LGSSKGLIGAAVAIAATLSGAVAALLLVGGAVDYDEWPKAPRGGGTTVEEGGVLGESASGGVRTVPRDSLGAFAGSSRRRGRRPAGTGRPRGAGSRRSESRRRRSRAAAPVRPP
jgi:hypothetical protein